MSGPKRFSHLGAAPPLRRARWSLVAALAALLLSGTLVLGQGGGATYDMSWHVMDGGGGPSAGTTYHVNYSFGQPSTIFSSAGSTYQISQNGYWQDDPVPTAADLLGFAALPDGAAIALTWETADEQELTGFDLYRQAGPGAPLERLNAAMIPARYAGSPQGALYTWHNGGVADGQLYLYTLELIDAGGDPQRVEPIAVVAPYAAFLPLARE